MAFEDRCSPQSAPSPPGIPHSPQKTSIVLTNNGKESQSNYSYTTEQEMSMMVPAVTVTNQSTSPSRITEPTTPNSTINECSTSPTTIKQEKRDAQIEKPTSPASQQTPNMPITFSITNILSNNFGNAKSPSNNSKKSPTNHNNNNNKVICGKRNGNLFRPYDDDCNNVGDNDSSSPKKEELTRRQQSDDEESNVDHDDDEEEIDVTDERTKFHQNVAIDFSNGLPINGDVHRLAQNILSPQQPSPHHHHHLHQQQLLNHYQAAVAVAQQSLHRTGAHSFIETNGLDAHHRLPLYSDFYHQTQTQHTQAQALAKQYYQTTRLLTDSVLAKYPPLGNLCKTVSQIGQSSNTPASILNGANKLTTQIRSDPLPNKKAQKRSAVHLDSTNDVLATVSTSSSSSVSNENASVTKAHQSNSMDSGMESSDDTKSETGSSKDENGSQWPAWIYCTRYSDRPSSGPRYRKPKQPKVKGDSEEKRPRTAFSMDQLARLKKEFNENRYLTERRRQQLSSELGLNEAQIKIWFQNKRAKIKKSSGQKNPLAMQLMAQGLYNHSTVPLTKEEEELEMRMNGQL